MNVFDFLIYIVCRVGMIWRLFVYNSLVVVYKKSILCFETARLI